jgi:glucose-6-phosphate dehydrogenase assembly protein OpcA
MANPVTTLSLWSDENVRIATVLEALDSLRRPEPMPPTRTSVLTLVVVARTMSSADRTAAALHELAGRHPARVLTLVVDEQSNEACIDAQLALLGSEAEGHPVWFEDVRLDVRGPVAGHLDSLIEPFTIPDLPVVAWFVDRLPDAHDPLLTAADVLLVDARDFGDTECFALLAALRDRPVVDLSWHRLRPWRELLASLFDPPAARRFLHAIRSVRVEGRTGPRHLLGGWLTSRLHVPTATVHLVEADHVTIEVIAEIDGRRGVFGVARESDAAVVRAQRRIEHGPSAEMFVPLPEPTPAWGLAAALSALERDEVYEAALDAAIALSNR